MIEQNIKLAVDMLVFGHGKDGLQLLMEKRKGDPFKGVWSLPGGFVEDGELTEEAALRELKEETNLELPHMKQLHVFDAVDRDPRFRTISVAHYAITDPATHTPTAGDDAAEVQWMAITDIPKQLAFDHANEIAYALKHLAGELQQPAK